MYKNRILNILIIFLVLIGIVNYSYATNQVMNNVDDKFHKIDSLSVPEKDINFRIENLTRGCEVYLLFPNELLDYNLGKFIENNIENNFNIQKQKAEELKRLYDQKDYLGYIDLLAQEGFDVDENCMEIRHYCISISETTEKLGYVDYNNVTYVKFKINMKDNFFKLILKDYLTQYDLSKIVFLIDEYGIETYVPISEYQFTENTINNNLDECNINYTLYTQEDYDSINRAIFIGYLIIFIIIAIIILGIILYQIRKHKEKKLEKAKILFWKKRSKKTEKALEKQRIREELKAIKQKRKGKKK